MSDRPQVTAVDYNTIRSKVVSILGTGTGTRGYGQTLNSSEVVQGNIITKAQWDSLKYDLVNAKTHQDGTRPTIVSLASGDVIRLGPSNPNTNYDSIADQVVLGRFNIGVGQSVLTAKGTQSFTGSFGARAECTLTVTFGTTDEARYFFNSGGQVKIVSSRAGGTSSQQNNAWTNLLSSVGTQSMGSNVPSIINFYSLTNSFQTMYQQSATSSYSSNYYSIEVKCDIASNVNAGARILTFKISFVDNYVDPGAPAPGDVVDGTLTISVSEQKATGAMEPSGTFTVVSPVYSLSSFTTS